MSTFQRKVKVCSKAKQTHKTLNKHPSEPGPALAGMLELSEQEFLMILRGFFFLNYFLLENEQGEGETDSSLSREPSTDLNPRTQGS